MEYRPRVGVSARDVDQVNSVKIRNAGVELPRAALVLENDARIAAALCESLLLAFPGVTPFMASTPAQARLLVLTERPQIGVVQLGLGGGGGIEFIVESCARTPSIHMVAAASHADSELIFPALRVGAKGYLMVPERRESMSRQLRAMLMGELPLTPPIARRFLEYFDAVGCTTLVTGLERELLTQVAAGRSLRDIAWRMAGGLDAVHAHLWCLYEKISSRQGAASPSPNLSEIEDFQGADPV